MRKEGQCGPVRVENTFNIVKLLKTCATQKDLVKGCKLHAYIGEHDFLEKNAHIGSTLVNMYVQCGALGKAQEVLENLPVRNVVTWTALIAGYTLQGQGDEALKCYDSMQHEGHSPNVVTFTCALKACGNIGAAAKGEEICEKILSLGMLEKDIVLGSTLVDMYAKCGALDKAQRVLMSLPFRSVVAWSALIAGYVEQGQGKEALNCYDQMLLEGQLPDAVTFACVLRACGSIGAVAKGEDIYDRIVSLGMLEKDIVLGGALVDMYAKCGELAKAHQVLEELSAQDVVTWSTLISRYVQQGHGEKALNCLDCMQHEGYFPNAVTLIYALKACGMIGAAIKGKEIHGKIVSLGMLEKDIVLGSALIGMYVKLGDLTQAQQMLDVLPVRNAVMWNALIAAYVQQGQGEEALKHFDGMICEGHPSNLDSFICALKACGIIGAAAKGKEIHDYIVSLGMLEKDIILGNALVSMYAKCGALLEAQQALKGLSLRNEVTWSILIAAYADQGQGEEALEYYECMLHDGHFPTAITFTYALKACGSIGATSRGKEIHDKIVSLGMLQKDIVLGGSLVDMYVRCGVLATAQQVLEELSLRGVVVWNVLIAGYVEQGHGEEALKCFDSMLREGHSADAVTFVFALKACGSIGAVAKGEEIHDKIVSLGMLEKDMVLGSVLVDMYTKCGALVKAWQVLEELHVRDVVTWSTLIGGYAQQQEGEKALNCFDYMLLEGHSPDNVTFTSALKASGTLGAAMKGEEIHDKVVASGLLEKDAVIGNTLVDMYAKCGQLEKAQKVFEQLPSRDVVTWSALIGGYAKQGQNLEAINYLARMQSMGVKPEPMTLTIILSAYSNSGLICQAQMFFSDISTKYGMNPDLDHYCCMLDLFGRAGKFDKALSVIGKMPFGECLPMWVTLLGACQKWEEVKIGRLAFQRAFHLDKSDATVYVLMANIYTAAGRQEDADIIEVIRVASKAQKIPMYVGGPMPGKKHIFL